MVTLLITLDPKTFASLQNLKKESEFPTNFILFKDNIQLSQNERLKINVIKMQLDFVVRITKLKL